MKRYTALVCSFLLLVGGCRRKLSNDEIIKETKKSQDAGMEAEYARDLDGNIGYVQCGPKEHPASGQPKPESKP